MSSDRHCPATLPHKDAIGCVVCGCQAFFDKDYISGHPQDGDKITQLKHLMQEQVRSERATSANVSCDDVSVNGRPLFQVHILGAGLAVHDKLVHPEMRPLHKKLVDQFQVMKSSLCHVRTSDGKICLQSQRHCHLGFPRHV